MVLEAATLDDPDIINRRNQILDEIQNRVLWLSIYMVDYANRLRPNPSGLKVGGHQASSASVASIMTYLFMEYMNAGDKLSVKPHASPVYHAVQYLLGNLDVEYLKTLRAYHGLQAYPSRTKDPDNVDFSTGSVGLGAVAPNFAWLTEEYLRSHIDSGNGPRRKYISIVGDAELDEGAVWEAVADPTMEEASNVLWIVDLNRQSLDRIIPGIRVTCWREMFAANGWSIVDAKYGRKLEAAFRLPNGELLRDAIDEMSNMVYQRLLRVSPSKLREWLPRTSRYPQDMERLISQWDDDELASLFSDLGGHDIGALRQAFDAMDLDTGPHVMFAYTLKGWRLPIIGDPQNHSANLNGEQMEVLRRNMGIDPNDTTFLFPSESRESKLIAEARERLRVGEEQSNSVPSIPVPTGFGRGYRGMMSTQQIFGLVLTEISRNAPELSKRLVTTSPDVASSTNLGGWINRVGVWHRGEVESLPQEEQPRALQWTESDTGQHIELGISENNLFMALGQLGLSHEMQGEILFPIGTLYDPFIRRGLDAFYYSTYAGASFMVVGTPSGVSLGPEGGAHQSLVTQSIGTELPDLSFYEPCFGQELEWIVMHSLERMRNREGSAYLRLTSKRVDQSLATLPSDPDELEKLRAQVLEGAYRLVDRRSEEGYGQHYNVVHIMASGAMVPEAVNASEQLLEEGVYANVINVTGPGPLYKRFQEQVRREISEGRASEPFMSDIFDVGERSAPIVTIVDGHPHTLAWLGAAMKTETFPLGVDDYGQSGDYLDLYREYQIDVDSIVAACFAAVD